MAGQTVIRTYLIRGAVFFGAYVAINAAAITGAFDDLQAPGSYVLALAVAAPVIGHIWAILDLMRCADEYLRALYARIFIIAAGLALALWTGWGFIESYADAPHLQGWLIYPLFWALYGLASPFVLRGAR
ncbi:hypothetical protein [Parvularcula oceani]|uniref:hypothetical protein n=1 Tax=Parvularcula oceani TaxID=1247963 RepID=UPI0004E150AD|nr:hypothetical protein [Parvularcula oceani]